MYIGRLGMFLFYQRHCFVLYCYYYCELFNGQPSIVVPPRETAVGKSEGISLQNLGNLVLFCLCFLSLLGLIHVHRLISYNSSMLTEVKGERM